MRIKKLLIAGALVLTAVGCVSAYTIYANTLNTTNKSVNNTTEDKSTTTEKQQTTVEKNKDVQDDNENVAKDIDNTSVKPTTETKKTTTSTEEDANDQEDSEPEYSDDADKTCSHVWAEKTIAYDEENGYHWTTYCEKCGTVKTEPATEEDYERLDPATKVKEEDIEYVDDDSAEVVEESTEAATEN